MEWTDDERMEIAAMVAADMIKHPQMHYAEVKDKSRLIVAVLTLSADFLNLNKFNYREYITRMARPAWSPVSDDRTP